MELTCANKFQMKPIIAALFHCSNFLRPKPPSSLGLQTISQFTLDLEDEVFEPFHKKLLNFCSAALITFLGRIIILDQYPWRLKMTDCINWSLPAYERFCCPWVYSCCDLVYEILHPKVYDRKLSFFELEQIQSLLFFYKLGGVAAIKILLFVKFSVNHNNLVNLSRASRTTWTDCTSVPRNTVKSSAKHKWVSYNAAHFEWCLKLVHSSTPFCKSLENTFMARTNK